MRKCGERRERAEKRTETNKRIRKTKIGFCGRTTTGRTVANKKKEKRALEEIFREISPISGDDQRFREYLNRSHYSKMTFFRLVGIENYLSLNLYYN